MAGKRIQHIFIIFIAVQNICNCVKPTSLENTFQKGVTAYSDERWSLCIEKFEAALHLFKLYKSVLINCRTKCNSQVYNSIIKEDIDDLRIFEKYFIRRDCLVKCQEKEFHKVNLDKNLGDSVLRKLQAKKTYEYLHICYFQMHMFDKAASSAYTYLLANPQDETMKSNLQYYIEQPEVNQNDVYNLESEEYILMYNLGRKSYDQKNWAETIHTLEEVLKDYFATENNCRVECERLPGQEWSSEYVITMSNNMASLLHCRQQCQESLRSLNYDTGVEFIADVLNYIQVAYFHLEKYADAAQAVGTYLALMPNDEDMLENVKFYSKHVDKDAFTQRSEVVHYLKRDVYEKQLLNFFHHGNKTDLDFDTVLNSYNFLK